jgi:hypothetical protein
MGDRLPERVVGAARIQEVSATVSPDKEAISSTDDSSSKKSPSMPYIHINSGERYTTGALHAQGFCQAAIARIPGRIGLPTSFVALATQAPTAGNP